MNIRIQIRHESAGNGIQTYITEEFSRLQEKYENIMTSADFVVDQEGPTGHVKTVEAILHVPGDTITVIERSDEVHKSIDVAMKVLDRQLQRHKETYSRPGAMIRHKVDREGMPSEASED